MATAIAAGHPLPRFQRHAVARVRLAAELKPLIPRRIRPLATRVYYRARSTMYRGSNVSCPCCGADFRRFLPVKPGEPGTICPGCGSFERHRLLWLYLFRVGGPLGRRKTRVLHVAPEAFLQDRLRRHPGVEYISGDLESPLAMVRFDITALPFADDEFDLVLCNHVLEHVPDDRRAMRELARVLRPTGTAILQTPYDKTRGSTYEDFAITDPDERERAFGHREHVRIYGRDLDTRLQAAGFTLTKDSFVRTLPRADVQRFGLPRTEEIYVCTKASDPVLK